MRFGIRERLLVCALVAMFTACFPRAAPSGEGFLATTMTVIGLSTFLLVKPAVPLRQRFQLIGLWDLMAPVLLVVYMIAIDPAGVGTHIYRLGYFVLFFVGMGTAGRLLLT